jgi:hypothetical protein
VELLEARKRLVVVVKLEATHGNSTCVDRLVPSTMETSYL